MATSHVIITGTGRAGTTFLVEFLTRLGLETGFDPVTMEVLPQYRAALRGQSSYFSEVRAGLEIRINAQDVPYIVKTPNMDVARTLRRSVQIEHAIIPVRSFEAAAASRIRNQRLQTGSDDGDVNVPGGLWGTDKASLQVDVLRERFSKIVEACVLHDVPITFLAFPRLLTDITYLRNRLQFLTGNIDYEYFSRAFDLTVNPDWVRNVAPADRRDPPAESS